MIDVIVFHHAHGLTAGVQAFADQLASAGHRVMTPDLYDGERFEVLDDGIEYAQRVGFDTIIDRGAGVASGTDEPFAVVGFSLGALPAQHLAQTHSRCRGAVLCHAAITLGTFSDEWPGAVGLQMHSCERDPLGDHDDAVLLAREVDGSELYTYDSAAHLPADDSLADYDPIVASEIVARSTEFLARLSP